MPASREILRDISGGLDPPANSYRLPLGAEIDWVDAKKVYDREESVKEVTNPKSHSHISNSKIVGNNSQRFSGNLKAGIIGLPGNMQNSSIMGHSARRPSCVRIIPQKNGSSSKPHALEAEPGSPKVSCMGKVLSDKPHNRSQANRKSAAKRTPRSGANKNSKSVAQRTPAKTEHKGPSCLFRVARMFCASRKRAMDVADESIRLEHGSDFSVSARISFGNDVRVKGRRSLERDVNTKETDILEKEMDTPVPVPVPGIGGIKRFASGRKVEWNFEAEIDNSDEVKESNCLEKKSDGKEINNFENEKDTPVPVLVLGLGGLKRFASGRKVDWNFEKETGNMMKDERKENNKLEKNADVKQRNVSEKEKDTTAVLGIGLMKKFASGRKLEWNFEVETDGGCVTKEEVKESDTLEKNVDNKEINVLEQEIGTKLPVPVLGIGMMRKLPSGRKVEWSFEVDTDEGCIATEDVKEKNTDTPGAVLVPGIGAMKRFASGRKVDWNFETESDNTEDAKEKKILRKDDDVKEKNSSEKERDTLVVSSVPRIGAMKRFPSGRKVDWNFDTETDNSEEAKENKTLKNDDVVKEKDTPVTVSVPKIGAMKRFASSRKVNWNFDVEADNAEEVKENSTLENKTDVHQRNNTLKKEPNTPVTVAPPGIGGMKKFASGRKLDWNFEVEA